MTPLSPIVFRELPMIQKIIRDETWLEGERRGCAVPPVDPVVRENVCLVILRVGRELREAAMRAEQTEGQAVSESVLLSMPSISDCAA